MAKKQIIFTSQNLRFPPRCGPEIRIVNSIRALSRAARLIVVVRRWQQPHVGEETVRWLDGLGAEVIHEGPPLGWPWYVRGPILKRLMHWNTLLREPRVSQTARFISELALSRHVNTIWIGYSGVSSHLVMKLRKQQPSSKVVADTDSVYSEFLIRMSRHQTVARRLLLYLLSRARNVQEMLMIRNATVVTCVSDRDRNVFLAMGCPREKLHLFVNGIDESDYQTFSVQAENRTKYDSDVLIVGSFGNAGSPMNGATSWFLGVVLPILRSNGYRIRVSIVGRGSSALEIIGDDTDIKIWGEVVSTGPFFQQARIMVVPLMFESGTRLKILEAGLTRCPVVSTTLGAEGLGLVDGTHYLCADTAEEMADAIAQLLSNRLLAKRLANSLYEHVIQNYSSQTLSQQAIDILNSL